MTRNIVFHGFQIKKIQIIKCNIHSEKKYRKREPKIIISSGKTSKIGSVWMD